MDKKNIILIVIVILVIALAAIAAYVYISDNNSSVDIVNASSANNTNNTTVIDIDQANDTIVGDNSTRADEPANLTNSNTTYKVYNPQTDSYVPVIGEKFDEEVNRWYTYDDQGVRYYNTRIN